MIPESTKLIYSLYDSAELDEVLSFLEKGKCPVEVILGFKEISRFWNCSFDECEQMAIKLKEKGATVFLQWDILMTESSFQSTFAGLKNKGCLDKKNLFDGIRVQDSGALQAIVESSFGGKVHFIAEQGNHNLKGLKSWLETAPEKITRLVLSPELPAKTLKEYADKLDCEIEILGFGPILLFYTPRHLVKPLYEGEQEDEIRVSGTSEESPHKGFPIRDNTHGTFMFNTKDQYILDEEEVKELSEIIYRIDLLEGKKNLKLETLRNTDMSTLKESYGRPLTKGFFRVNKTDVLFKKLKNSRLQGRDESLLGEIVDVKKDRHLGLIITHPELSLKVGETLELLSPEGREKTLAVRTLRDALGNDVEVAKSGDIVFLPPMGGISIKSLAFKK